MSTSPGRDATRSTPPVSGASDLLVVNVDERGCATLVFASDESGADDTVEDADEC